jgi:hypothetical protein
MYPSKALPACGRARLEFQVGIFSASVKEASMTKVTGKVLNKTKFVIA